MIHELRDKTPQGSAILAYGISRRPCFSWRLMVIIAFVLVATLVSLMWALATYVTFDVPAPRLALVGLVPKKIESRLPGVLKLDLAEPWRAAIQTKSNLPIVLGAWMDKENKPHAFALVYRHQTIADDAGLYVKNAGMMKLITDRADFSHESVPLKEFLKLFRSGRNHDAAWSLSGASLASFIDDLPVSNESMHGTWDGLHGIALMDRTDSLNVPDLSSHFIATLSPERGQAVPLMNALTSQGIDIRAMEASPSVIMIDDASRIHLGWSRDLSEHDANIALGAFGLTEQTERLLPDQTAIDELTPSTTLMEYEAMGDKDRTVLLSESGLMTAFNASESENACPGTLRLRLEGEFLANFLAYFGIPLTWQSALTSFEIRETGEAAYFCLNG